jgi:hypothetical protein
VLVLSPQESAASTSARFVMLFDPGTRTVAVGGRLSGVTSSLSGYGGIDDIPATDRK